MWWWIVFLVLSLASPAGADPTPPVIKCGLLQLYVQGPAGRIFRVRDGVEMINNGSQDWLCYQQWLAAGGHPIVLHL